jgi:hypothetical protein
MKKTLLFLLCFPTLIYSQIFNENFDGIGPGISGWTLYNQDNLTPNTNVSFVNGAWIRTLEEFDNNVAMSTSWYTPAGSSDDWLVSPQINLPAGTKTLYFDSRSYDATYKDSYKVYISTTGNNVSDFTTEVFTQGDGITPSSGENNVWTRRSVDLSAYTGNVYIAFRNFSNDMFLLAVDNVSLVTGSCDAPTRLITSTSTTTSLTLNWSAIAGVASYDVALVTPGTLPVIQSSPTTNTITFNSLTPNTRYQFYVRNSCGSIWIGPFSVFTANTLPYSYGFETTSANGSYNADGWSGAFSLNNTAGAAYYADGSQMVFSNSSTTAATNRWLFSRPIFLNTGEQVTLKFSTRSTSPTVNNTLIARVGSSPTTLTQPTILSTVTVVGTSFVENSTSYTAPSSGTYYFSFNHNNPATTAATSLVLDKIIFTSVLSSSEFTKFDFSIYPNPVTNILNISNPNNFEIKNLSIIDINGRVVKNQSDLSQINVSDLNAGVYFVTIESTDGKTTKKFIKQ